MRPLPGFFHKKSRQALPTDFAQQWHRKQIAQPTGISPADSGGDVLPVPTPHPRLGAKFGGLASPEFPARRLPPVLRIRNLYRWCLHHNTVFAPWQVGIFLFCARRGRFRNRRAGAPGRCRADSPIAGRGRSRVGPCCTRSQLASALNLPRLTQPRALGIYGASPAPYPGSLFPRRKSDQNAAGDTPDPVLPNRTPAKKPCAATETPRFGWLLVIGAVSYQPCLSAS